MHKWVKKCSYLLTLPGDVSTDYAGLLSNIRHCEYSRTNKKGYSRTTCCVVLAAIGHHDIL